MHALPNQRGAKSLVGALPLAKSGIVGRRVNKSRQSSRIVIADFCNKIGTNLPIRNVRFHGESWRVSGRATEIVETTFMTPEPTLMALAER